MPDLEVLRELTGQFERPQFDDLVAVSRKRRRRSALGAVAGVSAVVLAVGVTAAGLSDGQRAQEPIQQPSPSRIETPATGDDWSPERVRAEGSAVGFLGSGPSGLDAQLYCSGQAIPTGSPCDRYHPYDPAEDQHWAVEVTQGGRSALFEVRGTPLAKDFDEDSILVVDGPDHEPRFRLLSSDGTEVQLRVVSDLAPAVPGPDVVLIQALGTYRLGMVGPDGPHEPPYLVDERAATLQLLDVPEEIKEWGPDVHESLWGTNGCRAFWQQPDGSFDHHDVECRDPGLTDLPVDYWDHLEDWTKPGRMLLLEHDTSGSPLVVHASLDGGATWQRIEIEDRNWSGTIQEGVIAIRDVLDELG
jgi:hypothetical protein